MNQPSPDPTTTVGLPAPARRLLRGACGLLALLGALVAAVVQGWLPADDPVTPGLMWGTAALLWLLAGAGAATAGLRWRHADAQARSPQAADDPVPRPADPADSADPAESAVAVDPSVRAGRLDRLTGLLNRQALGLRLERALSHAARQAAPGCALLLVDVDRFRPINESLGSAAGDELLRALAQRLELTLRPCDAVARLGGDRFAAVLDGVAGPADLSPVAERVLVALAAPFHVDGRPLQVSVRIGAVLARPSDAASPADELLAQADAALAEAQRAGSGRWMLFDAQMHERAMRAAALETDLRRALLGDELFVVYQPVLDLHDRRLCGVEALARWRHPVRGLVPPLEFIPVAEESGLIDELGLLVLRQACAQFLRWRAELGDEAPAQLAVNLSRAQLRRDGFVHELRELLDATGFPADCLLLEVTESLAAQDGSIQGLLRQVKSLGVRLALDDFGTGYSSLACLHQLPVDVVKIDRSFVQHAHSVEVHRVLIDATIRVARTLGMRTVAEGIETEEQASLMAALDCDGGQGWLFSRPLEATAVVAWVRERDRELTIPG